MFTSVMFLIAALTQNAGASRFYPTPASYGSAFRTLHAAPMHDPTTRTPVRAVGPQMQEGASPGGQQLAYSFWPSQGGHNLAGNWLRIRGQEINLSFPPPTSQGIDLKLLLDVYDRLAHEATYKISTTQAGFDEMSSTQARRYVLQKMREVVTDQTAFLKYGQPRILLAEEIKRGRLETRFEAVGLQPNDLSRAALANMNNPGMPNEISRRSMMALGIFSRKKLKDDSRGSLRSMVEAQFGIKATRGMLGRPKKHISVFAIEGVAEAPFFPSDSARVLLAKIAEWARAEQKLVVVPKHVLHPGDGTDLTAYYMGLGFEKVEMGDTYTRTFPRGKRKMERESGSYELVYSYPAVPDMEYDHPMVGLSFHRQLSSYDDEMRAKLQL